MKNWVLLYVMLSMGVVNAQSWRVVTNEKTISPLGERTIVPTKYQVYHLVDSSFKNALWHAPNEKSVLLAHSTYLIELPMPDGTMKKFRVVESPVMAPELAAQFPSIKTFNVMDEEGKGISGKLDWTEMGFHAMLRNPAGDIYIDPYCRTNMTDYISYYKSDFEKAPEYLAGVEGDVRHNGKGFEKKSDVSTEANENKSITCVGDYLRTYRLAVACTGEYAVAATGVGSPTVGQVLSCIVTTVNRVDGVYETDLAIKMVLVGTETNVVFTNAGSDPFSGNNNANVLIDESQQVIDANIGNSNYDVGHTFSTGGGGLSTLGGVCVTGSKAQSITGSPNPVGDPYDIDYVAHEVGHDFGGNHTFRAVTGSCSFNQNPGTMVEPGSGITIMAYAGICAPNDDSAHSIPYFHAVSFDEIVNYTHFDNGNNCPVITATGNQIPVVASLTNYTIPVSTPFILTGSATDADGDVLRYSWEETDNNSTGGNWNSGTKPFFRSYNPGPPFRMFPKLSVALSGNYTSTIGEYLPTNAQTLHFRMTARDNKMGGGGVCSATSTVTVNGSAGPFAVTYPNTTGISWGSGSVQTITWDVNGTDAAPVSCSNVNILISYNGGNTFTTLMSNVPNSGSQAITVPTVGADVSTCRIKIESVGNVFFDINNKNFKITVGSTAGLTTYSASNLSMQLYPNPANDELNVVLSGLNSGEKHTLKMYDLLGNVVLNDQFQGEKGYTLHYSLAGFAQGMYIVEVSSSSMKAMSRLVKR